MKQICVFLLFLSWGIQHVYGQSDFTFMFNKEGKIIALPRRANFEFNVPRLSYKSYTPASTRLIDEMLKAYQPMATLKMDERPMDMQIKSAAYMPFYFEYAPMLKRQSPMAFDFKEVEFVPLNENLTAITTGRQQIWPGLGGQTDINSALSWHSGPWQVAGGGFVGRYFTPFNQSPKLVSGANIHASFQATDWLKINTWGQYAGYDSNERRNPHMLMNPFFYHNSIGTSLEFKLNEKFGMGAGVQYDFNPMIRKWERQVLVFPVFY